MFLRSSHTAAEGPIGGLLPDPEVLRSEFVSCKAMGFNMVRFIGRMPLRCQLEMADELGLMIYEENTASWMLQDSPKMAERFDRQLVGMARRDRNHPSIVIWGLLNETGDGPIFRHAVKALPLLRSLDPARVVLLGSGRHDSPPSFLNGLQVWKPAQGNAPNLIYNPLPHAVCLVPLWPAKAVALNPGTQGEYSVARWTAPAAGSYSVAAKFRGTGCYTTSDVHILRNGEPIYGGFINVQGRGDACDYSASLELAAGDHLDFAVGWGGSHFSATASLIPWTDNTQVSVEINSSTGSHFDLAADFSSSENPHGPWSYGSLAPGQVTNCSALALYAQCEKQHTSSVGGVSNPGSSEWESVLADQHWYPRVPHRALELERLRTLSADDHNLFLSEYGIGSGVHFPRVLRLYEQHGEGLLPGAKSYTDMLAAFMTDWDRFKLGDTFDAPEDFFDQCIAKMGALRKLGINALRANSRIIGYNVTGTHDPGTYGEGVITAFREHKAGTFDAMFDAFAPLRWCLFVEPVNVYCGAKIKLEAVLANEDALAPGAYPALLRVLGPGNERVFERSLTVQIPAKTNGAEPPFALPVLSEEVVLNGPPGKYRFVARLLQGGAPAGEMIEFYAADAREMPVVDSEVVLWGADPELADWLTAHGIKVRSFAAEPSGRELLLVPAQPPPPNDTNAWRALATRIARGSTAVFLSPEVFQKGDQPLGWLPLANKGGLTAVSEYTFPQVYLRDEWAKKHPVFAGLPSGLMDYTFYRELIPDHRFAGQDTPSEAVAGAFRTSAGYGSELMLSVYDLGSGRFILNSLRIRQALGHDPTAERLLRNLLLYAARDLDLPPADVPADFEATLKRIGY